MKKKFLSSLSIFVLLGILAVVWQIANMPGTCPSALPATAITPKQIEYQLAKDSVARVLRANGCSDAYADPLGRAAVDHNINPQLIAGIVFVESSCNASAISDKGAVGLMQINPRVWRYGLRTLRDPYANAQIGSKILAEYVQVHGLREGLHRYNGLGDDGSYGTKVLYAAYRR